MGKSKDDTAPSRILSRVMDKFKDREQEGLVKYGTTMDRNDLSLVEWLNHLQEEMMDATLYIEKLKQEVQYQEYELSEWKVWEEAEAKTWKELLKDEIQDKSRDSVEVAVDRSQPCGWDNTTISSDDDSSIRTTTRTIYPGDAWITTTS